MKRDIVTITDEEIENIFKISGVKRKDGNAYFKINQIVTGALSNISTDLGKACENRVILDSRIPQEVKLEDGYDASVRITEEGVFYKKGNPGSEENSIPNATQVTQYLIDQGFRFN